MKRYINPEIEILYLDVNCLLYISKEEIFDNLGEWDEGWFTK